MANRATSNSKLQEQSMKIAVQSQLAKIKKEDEEELWISGEELYTEGSSDEEEYKAQSRSRRKVNNNQPSRTFSTNPSGERRSYSPCSAEDRVKSICSKDTINETQSSHRNTSLFDQISSNNLSRSSSMTSQKTDCFSTVESSVYSMTKDSSDYSIEDDQTENTEISWKAKRELSYNNEELCEDECKDSLDTLSIDAEDEWIKKEMFQVKSLDNLIDTMNDKVKKASEETLFHQCENRKWLETILAKSPSETGKLAENTREFFYLCPKYTMLNEELEFRKSNESNISLETNDSKQNEDSVNPDDEDKWKLTNPTRFKENVNNIMQNSDENPYTMDEKMKEILLEVEEKILQSGLCNEQDQPLKDRGSISYRKRDATSTGKSPQDISYDFIEETIQEIQIVGPSSIVNVAEIELGA